MSAFSIGFKELLSKFKKKKIHINLKQVVSYTTRPMRSKETNGVEHWFVDNNTADDILAKELIAAFTTIGEYKYFVTKSQLEDQSTNLYIIDPDGIDYLLESFQDLREFIIVYIITDKKVRNTRAEKRPGYNEDIFLEREKSEDKEFSRFESRMEYYGSKYGLDVYSVNNNRKLKKSVKQFEKLVRRTYNPNIMYLVVGRTCSGKDTLCNTLSERLKQDA